MIQALLILLFLYGWKASYYWHKPFLGLDEEIQECMCISEYNILRQIGQRFILPQMLEHGLQEEHIENALPTGCWL